MREIKFRGFNGEKWLYGDLAIDYKTKQATISDDRWWRHPVRFDTVGQYTGLRDSDGHEIYEGDIVKCGTGRICEVVYFLSPVHAGYDLNPVGGFDCKPPSEFSLWSDLTIIGNVHDNPELLEQKP